jgi:hypothetical protein
MTRSFEHVHFYNATWAIHYVVVVGFERLRVLLWIINEEHYFEELLRTSSDGKFWAFSFQIISMSFYMLGTNVSLLLIVLVFYHLISCSRILCWFSFFLNLCSSHLKVSQEHQALNVCFIFHVFALWSFAIFQERKTFNVCFLFFLCLFFIKFLKNTKVIHLLPPDFVLWLFNELQPSMFIFLHVFASFSKALNL